MALNLLRNSRLFVSTLDTLNSTFTASATGPTNTINVSGVSAGSIQIGQFLTGVGLTATSPRVTALSLTTNASGVTSGTITVDSSQSTFSSTTVTGTDPRALSKTNCWEIPLQADFSFSQTNETQDITVNEAGASPTRGSARFNTALNPVEWSFSSYMRPYIAGAAFNSVTHRSAIERIMWHGLVSSNNVNLSSGGNAEARGNASTFHADFTSSNVHRFTQLYFYIKADNQWYKISPVQINQAEVDLAIDQLASVTWSGFGNNMARIPAPNFSTLSSNTAVTVTSADIGTDVFTLSAAPATPLYVGQPVVVSGTNSGALLAGYSNPTTYYVASVITPTTFTLKTTYYGSTNLDVTGTTGSTGLTFTLQENRMREYSSPVVVSGSTVSTTMNLADYIVQKYSTLTVTENGALTYTIPITGGNLSINNNITYLTPETLGVVNTPIGSFTGSREISGSLTCYLKTGGANDAGDLLQRLLTSTTSSVNSYTLTFNAGGSTAPKVTFTINNAMLSIPTVDVQDVLSLNIDYKVMGYTGSAGTTATDITAVNDMSIDYSPATTTTDTSDLGV